MQIIYKNASFLDAYYIFLVGKDGHRLMMNFLPKMHAAEVLTLEEVLDEWWVDQGDELFVRAAQASYNQLYLLYRVLAWNTHMAS